MSFTFTKHYEHPGTEGNRRVFYGELEIDSYNNGGEDVSDHNEFGVGVLQAIDFLDNLTSNDFFLRHDRSAETIIAREFTDTGDGTGGAGEAADTTDLGTINVRIVGKA